MSMATGSLTSKDIVMGRKLLFKKDLARCRRKIEKFNEQLRAYIEMTGDNEVPDIDCSIIGTSPMDYITIQETTNGFIYTDDGLDYTVEVVSECGEFWLDGEDELDYNLAYNRRRLRKGIRVWKSDNPDYELEREED